MRTFEDLTHDEVADILLIAMDSGDWHTPGVGSLEIKEQTRAVVYGKFLCSLHNTYWDKELWFNINANTVQLWEKVDQGTGRAEACLHRRIYNLKRLADIITPLDVKLQAAQQPKQQQQ